jgi:NAD(P)-dependent dehydrogenase (short-subunit alcohol dehydrogenase family)
VGVDGPLAGATALITGGAGSIGSSAALHMLCDGAAVLLMGRRRDALEQTRDYCLDQVPDGQVEVLSGNARDSADVRSAVSSAYAISGRLDIIVTTVGGGEFRPLLMHDAESFAEEFDLNVISAFLAIRHGVPLMGRGGAIVCVSSNASHNVTPWMSAYAVAKGALENLVRAAADEFGHLGIRVNAVRPGLTRTAEGHSKSADDRVVDAVLAEVPLNRIGRPDDIGAAIRYLAGPESSWVTGQSLAIDGGAELRKNPNIMEPLVKLYGRERIDSVLRGEAP